jgi:hypothetical protein
MTGSEDRDHNQTEMLFLVLNGITAGHNCENIINAMVHMLANVILIPFMRNTMTRLLTSLPSI